MLLILAGVSLNAIVGDNGIITNAMSAKFIEEMTSVQEAFDTWKMGKKVDDFDNNSLPTNDIVKAEVLQNNKRLMGEVGYYREWSLTGVRPSTNVKIDEDAFKDAGSAEITFYPAGVQDLYYIDNEILGLDSNKVYLIDAQNSMIYSLVGGTINGMKAHSLPMYRMLQNGADDMPKFAEAEVSGRNAGSKWLTDKDGNYVNEKGERVDEKDRVVNPYGFEIIGSSTSQNVFKLYNNGDLYGKGIKGPQLNTSVSEMEKINPYIWADFDLSSEFPNYKNIIFAFWTIYVIDKNDDLYVKGSNYGLTAEQKKEYTDREFIKIDIGDEKISQIFPAVRGTFIVTKSNKLLSSGLNTTGCMGVGHKNAMNEFEECKIPSEVNPSNIKEIKTGGDNGNYCAFLRTNDNKFYFAGVDGLGLLGAGKTGIECLTFTRCWGGSETPGMGPDIDHEIKKFGCVASCTVLKENGEIWVSGHRGVNFPELLNEPATQFVRYGNKLYDDIEIRSSGTDKILFGRDDEKTIYVTGYNGCFGEDYKNLKEQKLILPAGYKYSDVVDIKLMGGSCLFLMSDGEVFGTGSWSLLGENKYDGITKNFEKLNLSGVVNFDIEKTTYYNGMNIININGKMKITGSQNIMYGDDILEKSWKLVASNVKKFTGKGCAYLGMDNCLYVSGDTSYNLGLGEVSRSGQKVPNYIKCTDATIMGKVVDYAFGRETLYVLCDNNVVYCTGRGQVLGVSTYAGWGDTNTDNFNFVPVIDNVQKMFVAEASEYGSKCVIKKDETIWVWGQNYQGYLGNEATVFTETPVQITIKGLPEPISSLKVFYPFDTFRTFCITSDKKVYISGSWHHMYNGGQTTRYGFSVYEKFSNINASQVVALTVVNTIVLTEDGKIYGYGEANKIGEGFDINKVEAKQLAVGTDLADKNITQLVCYAGGYIAVTDKGEVWGTGSNIYGVLGRWTGIGRGESNSRYKTAGYWVECPDLEI